MVSMITQIQSNGGSDRVDGNIPKTSQKSKYKKKKEEPAKRRKKCRFEDEGKCKSKAACPYFHPRKTCKYFSQCGHCKTREQCNFRHPRGVCHEWEGRRKCLRQESCKFRHPQKVRERSNQEPQEKTSQQLQSLAQQQMVDKTMNQNVLKMPTTVATPPTFPFPPFLGFPPPVHPPGILTENIMNQMKMKNMNNPTITPQMMTFQRTHQVLPMAVGRDQVRQ